MAVTRKVAVIGTGYVGLPLAVMLARSGYEVVGVDIEEDIVKAINKGVLRLAEEAISQIFQEPQVRENLYAQPPVKRTRLLSLCARLLKNTGAIAKWEKLPSGDY